jgi:hypothetical protein
MEELGGEDVSERVRRDALPLVDAGHVDVVAKDLPELRVVQRLTLNADLFLWAAPRPH